MAESLYSTSEVARLFEINRVTIYRWVQDGVVKAYKVGKHLKIPASEVERLWKEFGFPEGPHTHSTDFFQKDGSGDSVDAPVKFKKQKKIVIAVDADEAHCEVIRDIFTRKELNKTCALETYRDKLEAALAIGKAKPDLLLIRIAENDGTGEAFAQKIRDIHSDIKIIFVGDGSARRRNKGEAAYRDENGVTVNWVGLYPEIAKVLGIVRGAPE
ncbi:MAG TPA: helix-turn-helix domain-containing protein [Syntrophales bacterium]|nr:helix-turn-helix domain-containing protein [Syntrophales bacterium]